MENVMQVLEELFPDIDFQGEQELVDAGVLTSLELVMLVGELNDRFNIEITAEDLVPENFNSASAIGALVERLQEL